ncbi:SAM-dependent methyltransferase [Streptomyces sp. NBC_00566]|nr:SAM-dependent methyltransferase [Streptomyces sp. NBC_00566]WUB85265.1 SAM-dependent methyltransferase [Streptomyces sp. NBC_00566]
MRDTERQPTSIDTGRPHPARMYDWFLGGEDNHPVDRAAGEQVRSPPTSRPTPTADVDPDTWHAVVDVYRRAGTPVRLRSRDGFTEFFAGLDLLDPGIAFVADWRPDITGRKQGERLPLYAAVGRKQAPAGGVHSPARPVTSQNGPELSK